MAIDFPIIMNYQGGAGKSNLIKDATKARIFFVDSTGGGSTTSGGLTPDTAFTTLASAIAACTANKDDVIYVMPGHSESFSGATALNINVAGISIIGVGNKSNRPTFTWHTTDALVTVSAANVLIQDVRCTCDITAVVTMFSITGAGVTFNRVDYFDTASVQPLQFILTTATGDDLTITNCKWIASQTAAASVQAWIGLVGADRFKCDNCYSNLKGAVATAANGVIVGATTASNDVEIINNRFITTNSTSAIPISLLANTTGFVHNNCVASAKSAIAGQVACASCYAGENFASHVVNKSGLLDPVVDA